MERKNTILLTVIAIATLLVAVVGATFAYFTATIQDNRTADDGNGSTNVSTGRVANTTVVANVEGAAGKFTATDVYPGHKEVAALQVTATSSNSEASTTKVQFTYDVTTNELGDNAKISLYKSETLIPTTENYFACTKKTAEGTADGAVNYFEECDSTKLVGDIIGTAKTITGDGTTVDLGTDTISTTSSKTVYYYVVVEFENKNESQNDVMGKTLTGTVSVKAAA